MIGTGLGSETKSCGSTWSFLFAVSSSASHWRCEVLFRVPGLVGPVHTLIIGGRQCKIYIPLSTLRPVTKRPTKTTVHSITFCITAGSSTPVVSNCTAHLDRGFLIAICLANNSPGFKFLPATTSGTTSDAVYVYSQSGTIKYKLLTSMYYSSSFTHSGKERSRLIVVSLNYITLNSFVAFV
jgi:hypothetical protein